MPAADYPGVPKSSIYEVTVVEGNVSRQLPVFQSTCPGYRAGYMNMKPVDENPFQRFKGRTINWINFSFSDRADIQVRVLDTNMVSMKATVKILPSRYDLKPVVKGNRISFTMTKPGQYSVEIGDAGYKKGLLIFANPPETDKPDPAAGNYFTLTNATAATINSVPETSSGIYFTAGVHNKRVQGVRLEWRLN